MSLGQEWARADLWPRRSGPATRRFLITVSRVFGAFMLFPSALLWMGAGLELAQDSRWDSVVTLSAATLTAVAGACLLMRLLPSMVVLVTVLAAASPRLPDVTNSEVSIVSGVLVATAILGAVLTLSRMWALTLGTGLVIVVAIISANVGTPWRNYLTPSVFNLGIVVAGAGLMAILVRTTERIDGVTERVIEAEQHARVQGVEEETAGQIRLLLHGTVISALGAIASGAGGPEHARRASSRAVDMLTDRERVVDTTSSAEWNVHRFVERMRRLTPLELTVECVAQGGPALPTFVSAALEEACGEALRNVLRHSGATAASLRIAATATSVRIEVADDGVGIGPGTAPGFGIRQSIVESMERVAGVATVQSGDPSGTVVTLSWGRDEDPRKGLGSTYDATTRSVTAEHPFATCGVPLVVSQLAGAAIQSLAPPRLGLFMLAIGSAAVTSLVINSLERRAPTTKQVVALGVAVVAIESIGMWLTGPASIRDFSSWYIGFMSVPALLMAFAVPWRYALSLVAVVVAPVATVVAASPAISWGRASGALISGFPVFIAWALGAQLRRNDRELHAEREHLLVALTEGARTAIADRVSTAQLRFAHDEVVPFLRSVIAMPTLMESPVVQGEAQALASMIRDELSLANELDPALRRRIAGFRRAGGTVRLWSGENPSASARVAIRILDRLLDVAAPEATVTLSLGSGDQMCRASVAPAPAIGSQSLQSALCDVEHTVRETRQVLQIRFRDLPPAGSGFVGEAQIETQK